MTGDENPEPADYDTEFLKRYRKSVDMSVILHINVTIDRLSDEQFTELRSAVQIIERLGNVEVAT